MKTFIFSILSLGVGFGGGYLLANKLTKNKYLKKADEEVKSVKESLEKYYDEKLEALQAPTIAAQEETVEKEEPKKKKTTKRSRPNVPVINQDSINYDDLKDNNNDEKAYKKYAKQYRPQENDKEEEPLNKPYILSPSEFADSDYDVRTLTWYSDGVLADDEFNVIEDIKGYVGDEALNSFGMYNLEVVYVRNEKYKIDYEILLDERNHKDVAPKGVSTPFPGDDE